MIRSLTDFILNSDDPAIGSINNDSSGMKFSKIETMKFLRNEIYLLLYTSPVCKLGLLLSQASSY
jgi:hypothetical protein